MLEGEGPDERNDDKRDRDAEWLEQKLHDDVGDPVCSGSGHEGMIIERIPVA